MPDSLTAALTAAGIVYQLADFSDPQLDGPTPLQVTDDGRVYGHLACWDTPHIGHADLITPPHSSQGYRYFHQGVVRTEAGDLPVGKLTIGTGHAGPGGDPIAAAAHYDNTGSTVAVVRAGEDRHGIWLAGRVLPGTDEATVDELRRSSVSGDWRDVQRNGQFELVAALAVNVPGFPIPRTETLVAGGQPVGLVAAGIVARRNPADPVTYGDLDEILAAAMADAKKKDERKKALVEKMAEVTGEIEAEKAQKRRGAAVEAVEAIAKDKRKKKAREKVAEVLAAGAVQAKVNDATGRMPAQLHRYWTSGKGLARWATTPTPYRSLVTALQSEIKDMTPEQIKGLAARLYHDVFREWPGRQRGDKDGAGKARAAVKKAVA